MKNVKKLGILALVLVLALGTLAACGGGDSSSSEDKTITVAASPTPHAEILNSDAVKDALAEEGYELVVKEFDDYVQPNVATTDGDVDANYFQHIPYLNDYNEQNGTDLVAVADVHYEPMQVHAASKDSFDALSEGDKIVVPNDATNEGRALLLLESYGVITLKDSTNLASTATDIAENPKGIEIVEMEAASIPEALNDPKVALGVINANYAIGAGLKTEDAIAIEKADETSYINAIVVTAENQDSEKTKALVAAIQTDAVKQFIEETYSDGSVVAKF